MEICVELEQDGCGGFVVEVVMWLSGTKSPG